MKFIEAALKRLKHRFSLVFDVDSIVIEEEDLP